MTELGTVVGTSTKAGNVTTLTPSYTDTGPPQAGDKALLFWGHNTASVETATPAAFAKPFTQHASSPQDDGTERLQLWTRDCDGTETGSAGNLVLSVGARQGAILILVRGGGGIVVMTKTPDAGTDANHTLPALTPTWDDVFVVGCVAERATTGSSSVSSVPAGYTNAADTGAAASGSGGQFLAVIYEGSAGTFTSNHAHGVAINPGTVVFNTSQTDVSAMTVAIRPKGKTLTPAAETDSATGLTRVKRRTTSPAAETDAVVAAGRKKSRTVTPATETDAAVVLTGGTTGASVISRTITPATETETAPTLTRVKRKTAAVATETGAAQTLGRVKRRALSPAAETDTAVVVARRKSRTVAAATELDTVTLSRVKRRTATPAAETDTARQLTMRKARSVSPALETDVAVALVREIDALPQPILEWNGTTWVPTDDDWIPTGLASTPTGEGPVMVWTGSHWIPDPRAAWIPS